MLNNQTEALYYLISAQIHHKQDYKYTCEHNHNLLHTQIFHLYIQVLLLHTLHMMLEVFESFLTPSCIFSALNSEKKSFQARCKKFEEERTKIYKLINQNTVPGASCSYIYDFFREHSFYYVVTEKIEGFELCPKKLSECLPIEERIILFRIILYSLGNALNVP